jgi:hypothetical protein
MLDLWSTKRSATALTHKPTQRLPKKSNQYLTELRDKKTAAGTGGNLFVGIRSDYLRNSSSGSFPPVQVQILATQALNETDQDTAQI